MAWHLGEPGKPKVVLIAGMHGNEPAPRQILQSLRDGDQIHGVNLWVVPTYNPDGAAAGTRKNAHGVDLNRNFPYRWADLDGNYESGSEAGLRAGDPRDDEVPARGPAGRGSSASTSRCTASTPTPSGRRFAAPGRPAPRPAGQEASPAAASATAP